MSSKKPTHDPLVEAVAVAIFRAQQRAIWGKDEDKYEWSSLSTDKDVDRTMFPNVLSRQDMYRCMATSAIQAMQEH